MINLLNPIEKKRLRAARRNLTWTRYILLTLAFFAAINILFGAVAFNLYLEQGNLTRYIAENEAEKAKKYKKIEEEASTFRKNLDAAKTILSGEVTYSKTILAVAKIVPDGCVLKGLTLNSQSFDVPQSFAFECRDRNYILDLKTKLESSTAVFKEVNIVDARAKDTANEKYKWTINISAVLQKSVETSSQPEVSR